MDHQSLPEYFKHIGDKIYIYYFVDLVDNLEEIFGELLHTNLYPGNVLHNYYPDEYFDVVYANNFLHCLSYRTLEEIGYCNPKDKIKATLKEAYRLLKDDNIFFGRMLSNFLDVDKLHYLELKYDRSEKEEFIRRTGIALKDGALVGISPLELENYAREIGFQKTYIEVKSDGWKPIKDFYFRFEK